MPYAMVRVSLFFVAGILLAIYQPEILSEKAAIWCGVVLAFIYCILFFLRRKLRLTEALGLVGLLFMFVAGYVHLQQATEPLRHDHLSHRPNVTGIVAVVSSGISEREHSWRMVLEVERTFTGDEMQNTSGKVYFYWPKRLGSPPLFYGDRILLKGTPEPIAPPGNPEEFDYRRFLTFRNIFHQQFFRGDEWVLLNRATEKDVFYYSLLAREWAITQLARHVEGERELAIAMALTLGVTDGIDNELQGAYASSGAMHVLAVSGLHVGILYAIVALLLRPFRDTARGKWLVAAISLTALWSFAFVTGLSPSVQRAVMMFTFVAIGRAMGRGSNIYNTLAASAFVLLLFNPYLVMSVGFQLSYLAVIGIVTLHRPLYLLWEPASAALDWIWRISCIAIAAQLSTFALGLLYFHQFPVYFMVSNLFVIPGATVILVLSIAVIAFSFIPIIASTLGALLQLCVQIVNAGVFAVEDLPYSLVEGIYINTFQAWLLMGMVSFVYLLLLQRQFQYLLLASACVIAFSLVQWTQYQSDRQGSLLVVYNVRGHQAMEWMSDGKSVFHTDSVLLRDEEKIRFHVRPLRLQRGITNVQSVVLQRAPTSWNFMTARVAYIGEAGKMWKQPLEVDFLILGHNAFKHYDEIASVVRFKKLVLDASNSPWISKRIKDEAGDPSVVHSVVHQGAYVHKF